MTGKLFGCILDKTQLFTLYFSRSYDFQTPFSSVKTTDFLRPHWQDILDVALVENPEAVKSCQFRSLRSVKRRWCW